MGARSKPFSCSQLKMRNFFCLGVAFLVLIAASGTSGKPVPDPAAPAIAALAVLTPLVPVLRALLAPVRGHVGRIATRTVVTCVTNDCKTSGCADITCEIEIYQ